MEIKFIWIKDYRTIKDLGINFNNSGQHSFVYENNKLTLLSNHINEIDFGSNILGVTVIAGQNGAGKSSICEIILETVATYTGGHMGWNQVFDGIVIYSDHIFYHKDLMIGNISELEKEGYTLVSFDETPFETMKAEWNQSFAKAGFIYYSNVIDRRTAIDITNLVNISTTNLLFSDSRYGTFNTFQKPLPGVVTNTDTGKPKVYQLEAFWAAEGYRYMKFYLKYRDSMKLKEPLVLQLQSSYSLDNRHLYNNDSNFSVRAFDDLEGYIFDTVYPSYRPYHETDLLDTDTVTLKSAVHNLYKVNILRAICINKRKEIKPEVISNYLLHNMEMSHFFEKNAAAEKLFSIHKKLVDNGDVIKNYTIGQLRYNDDGENWRFLAIKYLFLDNNSENRKLLSELIRLEEGLLNDEKHTLHRISNFSFSPQMSSGELSVYSLFSRLNDTFDRYEEGFYEKKSVIVFIDEAEIGFHPAWKRSFFKTLLLFFEQYPSYKFQLILTTHSPYLLSDLASANIILLHKDEKGKPSILPKDTIKTFGANIHDLLADSFFLKDGFIGDFARDKLNQLFKYLSTHESNPGTDEKNKAKALIDLVGEPILKSQLVQLYDMKFNENIELDFISEEIQRLEEIKTRMQNDKNRTQ
jgi:predicted ATPase